jgi:cold shock CspA family protein
MRKQGRGVSWKLDNGYGVVEPFARGQQVFVHVSAFLGAACAPAIGLRVSYLESTDVRGRTRVEKIQ